MPTLPQDLPLPKGSSALEQINLHAAGIDVGSAEHWVCVPEGRDVERVRRFGCYTQQLQELADWLSHCQVQTVAMEATGVYWIPLFQILESRGFEVKLVNAHFVKTVPGRKSDVLDCQWLQQLHTYGLLAGSFRPDEQICVLRSYIRQRDTLIRSSSVHIQRMQKALNQMNVQLHQVVSDITGVTGMAIIEAIVVGERDPHRLAALRDPRVKASVSEIALALGGDFRPEHVFVLRQELALYRTFVSQIAECDQQIEQWLQRFEDKSQGQAPLPPRPKHKRPSRHAPKFDLRTQLYRISGVDFTAIDGLEALSVQTILSEVGLDWSRFPSFKQFSSWLGLSPGSRISGGKVLSSQTRRVINRAATAFRLAAQSVSRSQSAIGAYYRRMRTRLGAPKAITATAHKIARIFYHLWRTKEPYVDSGAAYYEEKYRQRTLDSLKRKAKQLGFDLIPQPVTEEVS
jgi:transposase